MLMIAMVALTAVFLLARAESIADGVGEGIVLAVNQVIPSLYPFLILTSFLSRQNISIPESSWIARVFTRLFKLPPHCLISAVMAAVGGFPAGLKMTEELRQSGRLTDVQTRIMTACCFHAGPAFLITAVGQNMFGSRKAGLLLMSSTLLSSFITGLIAAAGKEAPKEQMPQAPAAASLSETLVASVTAAAKAMYAACIWICIFMGVFRGLEAVFGTLPSVMYLLAEVTTGCMRCAERTSLPLAAAACAFGGFCVHCQMLPTLVNIKIKYRYFLRYRFIHSLLAYGICLILEKIFAPAVTASLSVHSGGELLLSVPQLLLLGTISAVLIWDTAPKRQKDD